MDPSPLPALPVPLIGALVLATFLVVAWLRGRAAFGLLALIGASALQLFVVALAQHWHWAPARAVQPATAVVVPAVAWVAFRRGAVRGRAFVRDLPHVTGPLAVAMLAASMPQLLDIAVPALFAGYGIAIAHAARTGVDATPLARLEHGGATARLWWLIGGALIVSAASDFAITGALAVGHAGFAGWILTVTTTGLLVAIGVIALAAPLDGDRREPAEETETARERAPATPEDVEIMARLARLSAERQLHLDPDLTLTRLARRLGVPGKALSAAVNRTTGENVSRFVNRHRIEEACRRLSAGETVTDAMLSSGFATKSNFNREFLRIVGKTPSAFRAARLVGEGAEEGRSRREAEA